MRRRDLGLRGTTKVPKESASERVNQQLSEDQRRHSAAISVDDARRRYRGGMEMVVVTVVVVTDVPIIGDQETGQDCRSLYLFRFYSETIFIVMSCEHVCDFPQSSQSENSSTTRYVTNGGDFRGPGELLRPQEGMDFQSAMDTFVEAWMAANTKTDQVQERSTLTLQSATIYVTRSQTHQSADYLSQRDIQLSFGDIAGSIFR
ncbi:hypothetical protein ALC53_01717 [Atta colombica]|uniref:Uncharacterized protein n=1 Tax=Atta colombica TaxID=520822 RepID=A0A195BUT0_9HYME|nr:hypothetical protein ALC53_01717 [Atta colombica]